MYSNTYSIPVPAGLGRLAAVVEELAAQDLAALPAAEAAQRVLALRGLLERLEGQWLRELAAVDARGAAGAEDGTQADSTAGWLRRRLRAGATQASGWVRMARALFRGPLPGTGRALAAGELSFAHAAVLAHGTQDLPAPTVMEAEPVLVDAACRLDPPRLRRLVAHLHQVADPDGASEQTQRQHQRRGMWVSPTFEGMVAIDGLLEPEAGETLLAALEPLARPTTADDQRVAPSGARTRWPSWPDAPWRAAGCRTPGESARSSPSPSSWPACSAATAPLAERVPGRGRCPPRPPSGWSATPRSPAPSSPAATTATATPTGWPAGCGPR